MPLCPMSSGIGVDTEIMKLVSGGLGRVSAVGQRDATSKPGLRSPASVSNPDGANPALRKEFFSPSPSGPTLWDQSGGDTDGKHLLRTIDQPLLAMLGGSSAILMHDA